METDAIAIPVDLTSEKNENANATLLYPNTTKVSNNRRYATSEFHQFWVVLKRTLLFSRRDWVSVLDILSYSRLTYNVIGDLYFPPFVSPFVKFKILLGLIKFVGEKLCLYYTIL